MIELSALPTQLTDRFEMMNQLGKGGFATVYLARDKTLGRKVAIKIYHPEDRPETEVLKNEAQILASLRHPNIVTIYDAGTEDNCLYIVMEYLDGGSLREKLRPGSPPMRPQDAVGLVALLAEALHAAHEADILHLDIKPENIMFDKGGRPYLTDFGIGRVMGEDQATRQTRAMGTNTYASPEQRQGGRLTMASDIYSLGVVLFELLTNQVPVGPAPAHVQPPFSPPFPMNHPLTTARELTLLVCKALAVAPEYRYESALQFAHQLRDYILHAVEDTGGLAAPVVRPRQRPFTAPIITRVQIREPERVLRQAESRRIPRSVREMMHDLPPIPPGTRANNMVYSHQALEVGVGSVVEQTVFARGRLRLRQDAVVMGDAISLSSVDVSQGVQARNVFAPEVTLRGPIRLEGSIFCRRMRPGRPGESEFHLPDNSELGGSLIFSPSFEKVVEDEELGRPLNEPRQPIETYHRPEVRVGTQCTLVAILGDVDVEIDPRQKQLNTIRVDGNVKIGRSNTVRRVEGADVEIGPACVIDEVYAHGKLIIGAGSRIGYARACKGIELAHGVVISSPVIFTDNGAILELGEAHWTTDEELVDLAAYHLFDFQQEEEKGSLATILLDHRLYQLYDRIAPGWLPRLQPTDFEGSGEQVKRPAQKALPEQEYLEFPLDLTPASERMRDEEEEDAAEQVEAEDVAPVEEFKVRTDGTQAAVEQEDATGPGMPVKEDDPASHAIPDSRSEAKTRLSEPTDGAHAEAGAGQQKPRQPDDEGATRLLNPFKRQDEIRRQMELRRRREEEESGE